MLIEFTVSNFLSFKEPVTISFLASNITELKSTNMFKKGRYKLLKSVAIYGANASGKSNLFKAIAFMKKFVRESSKNYQAGDSIPYSPFAFNTDTLQKCSTFESVFAIGDETYRYGFQVNSEEVKAEWLFFSTDKKEKMLFLREDEQISLGDDFEEGAGLENKTRENALFLSVVSQFNGMKSSKIVKYFTKQLNVISGLNNEYTMMSSKMLTDNEKYRSKFHELIKMSDLGIEDIEIEEREVDFSELPDFMRDIIKSKSDENFGGLKSLNISMVHKQFDSTNKHIANMKMDMEEYESEGTKKLFSILSPILDSLEKGKVLIVDELDSSMHPILTKFIVQLFNSEESNPNNAQLLFNTHDSNLLSNKLFRRDQIWFSEKDRFGASHLYSLVDYSYESKTIRKDEMYEKNYLNGKYGAIPYLGQFEFNLLKGE